MSPLSLEKTGHLDWTHKGTPMTTTQQELALLQQLISAADEKKAADIKTFDLQGQSMIADHMVVLSTNNTVHIDAILAGLKSALKGISKQDLPQRISGTSESGWVIFDLGFCIFHIMTQELRTYYHIDELFEKYSAVVYYS